MVGTWLRRVMTIACPSVSKDYELLHSMLNPCLLATGFLLARTFSESMGIGGISADGSGVSPKKRGRCSKMEEL